MPIPSSAPPSSLSQSFYPPPAQYYLQQQQQQQQLQQQQQQQHQGTPISTPRHLPLNGPVKSHFTDHPQLFHNGSSSTSTAAGTPTPSFNPLVNHHPIGPPAGTPNGYGLYQAPAQQHQQQAAPPQPPRTVDPRSFFAQPPPQPQQQQVPPAAPPPLSSSYAPLSSSFPSAAQQQQLLQSPRKQRKLTNPTMPSTGGPTGAGLTQQQREQLQRMQLGVHMQGQQQISSGAGPGSGGAGMGAGMNGMGGMGMGVQQQMAIFQQQQQRAALMQQQQHHQGSIHPYVAPPTPFFNQHPQPPVPPTHPHPQPPPPAPVAPPAPPPPSALSHIPPSLLPQATTRLTPLPAPTSESDTTHSGALPPLSQLEMDRVKKWIERDRKYTSSESETSISKMREEEMSLGLTMGVGRKMWWERDLGGHDDEHMNVYGMNGLNIIWPESLKDRMMRKFGRGVVFVLPAATRKAQGSSSKGESLVPIRIEIEYEQYRLRETFIWNINDISITPEQFAQTTCEDMGLPLACVNSFVTQMRAQLTDLGVYNVVGEEDGNEWDGRGCGDIGWRGGSGDVVEKEVEEIGEEMRVLIKLDIIVGSQNLVDSFEWDIKNGSVEDGGIERFAEVYGTELGLSGEFVTAISHSIREQILLYQKSIFLDPSTSSEILLPTISTSDQSTIYRSSDQIQHTTPFLSTLSLAELEKLEREREKEVRRKKRQTRGRRAGGVPGGGDWREVQKTWRSAVGNVTMINLNEGGGEGSNFFNNNSVVPVGTRRAAAAAASATIASLAASENGTSYHHTHHHQITLTATQPNHPAPSAPPKAKRQKIFHQQGPNLPQSIFIERSTYSLNTLTSSTSLNNPSTSDLTSFSRPPNKKPPTPTTSTPRAPTARQLKEAKEKEYAEGQRENYINGEWHCSNCGCPDAIAVGRRKGPLGDKTMCGECGRFYHRHRRPNAVEYNTDPEYHIRKRDGTKGGTPGTGASKKGSHKKKGSRGIMRIGTPPESPTPIPLAMLSHAKEEELPVLVQGDVVGPIAAPSKDEEKKPPTVGDGGEEKPPDNSIQHYRALSPPNAPEWLKECLVKAKASNPHDDFAAIPKAAASGEEGAIEWRIKCFDCPGKLYTPGPDLTLSNFEVHLKNRNHRANVTKRLSLSTSSS